MAIIRRTLEDIKENKVIASKTPSKIIFDNETAPDMASEMLIHPKMIRARLKMTQEEFSALIRVPLGTLRNWEQGRVLPEPAARSLMIVMAANLETAVNALKAA